MTTHRKEGLPLSGTSYRLVRRIGAGSTSEVYEAIGSRGQLLAIKLLRSIHLGSPALVGRLQLEGRALLAVQHPHLVKVYDVGVTTDGRPFLVMPRLRGQTLYDRMESTGPLPPWMAIALVLQILDGLAAAHKAGIVHRDIKPANVFLKQTIRTHLGATTDHVIVLDFGVAKVSFAALDPSTGSQVIGTPRYLAPEQVLGGVIDHRADIYTVGLLLFEIVAGRAPFVDNDTLNLMRAHIHIPAPRLRSLLWVPPALDHAVARALEKAPGQRWQSADEMAEALRTVYDDPRSFEQTPLYSEARAQ